MRLVVDKNTLKKAVSKLKAVVAAPTINPIMEHFLFDVRGNVLVVKAASGQVALVWASKLKEKHDKFLFTLPGNTLCSLIASLEKDDVVFEYDPETTDVKMTCGSFSWESPSGKIETFPDLVPPKDLKEIELPDDFLDRLKSVYFSISNDANKPDLNSLCVDVNKDGSGKINLISTDRNRLSSSYFETTCKDQTRFVIPKTSVAEIIKLEPKSLLYDSKRDKIYFRAEDISGSYLFWSVLTNYDYPDIYAYLSDTFSKEKTISINKNELSRALKRVKTTVNDVEKYGAFEFKKNKIVVSSHSGSLSKAKEEVSVKYEDEENLPDRFTIRLDFILEYLAQETSSEITLKVFGNKCIVFDKSEHRHVLSINS